MLSGAGMAVGGVHSRDAGKDHFRADRPRRFNVKTVRLMNVITSSEWAWQPIRVVPRIFRPVFKNRIFLLIWRFITEES